jgi:hypothetical protein
MVEPYQGNGSFPPKADMNYFTVMGRVAKTVIAAGLFLAGCSKQLPEICRTTPPESSEGSGYDKWLAQYKAAHCKERLQNAAHNSAVS